MKKENAENRELRVEKILNAPVKLLWEAWTNPEQIVNWWAPTGFTSTIHKMDVTGRGMAYDPAWNRREKLSNKSIFKEIMPLRKIIYEHFNPNFIATVVFKQKIIRP